ncbi:hypothetical protein [Comamonas terrigena]|uniref:Uncharacterized protein n=1 Tax=Comamonas terrigena TaxID=32013 RepID=A0A2A7UXS3_COMTR|nr:hypothetical protein [Comamonas terrigena]PEH90092.1 hypothetical protein CRM82_17160 [Comamonas terrigena]BBL25384.1 hypothetical protein CT3_28390 [Comamonas terrigena NBRC 13299]SUY71040.1 Uncharacterised protein [Comamonas terrigena]
MKAVDHKLCKKCNEEWPADTEFFYSQPGGYLNLAHCCKACYKEHVRRADSRRKEPVAAAAPRITDCLQGLLTGLLHQGARA